MSNLSFTQEQRTLEWYRARLGYITGSQVGSLMKSGRTKDKVFSDTALTYLYQLAGERSLNPEIVKDDNMFTFYLEQTTSQSKAMRFGTEQEENARAMYVDITGREVKEVGLCHHPQIKYLASSPDGITAIWRRDGMRRNQMPHTVNIQQVCCGNPRQRITQESQSRLLLSVSEPHGLH